MLECLENLCRPISSLQNIYQDIKNKGDLSWYYKKTLYFNFHSGAEKSISAEYHRIKGNCVNIHP